eukprot:38148_1
MTEPLIGSDTSCGSQCAWLCNAFNNYPPIEQLIDPLWKDVVYNLSTRVIDLIHSIILCVFTTLIIIHIQSNSFGDINISFLLVSITFLYSFNILVDVILSIALIIKYFSYYTQKYPFISVLLVFPVVFVGLNIALLLCPNYSFKLMNLKRFFHDRYQHMFSVHYKHYRYISDLAIYCMQKIMDKHVMQKIIASNYYLMTVFHNEMPDKIQNDKKIQHIVKLHAQYKIKDMTWSDITNSTQNKYDVNMLRLTGFK